MIDCDDQPLDNEYEQGLRDRATAAFVAWQARHHTAWAQGRYAAYHATMLSMAFLPDGVHIQRT